MDCLIECVEEVGIADMLLWCAGSWGSLLMVSMSSTYLRLVLCPEFNLPGVTFSTCVGAVAITHGLMGESAPIVRVSACNGRESNLFACNETITPASSSGSGNLHSSGDVEEQLTGSCMLFAGVHCNGEYNNIAVLECGEVVAITTASGMNVQHSVCI